MFQLLGGLWYDILHPWNTQCNSDFSDCHTSWRKSRTAYADDNEPLITFLTKQGAWHPPAAKEQTAAIPEAIGVPLSQSSSA